MDLDPRYLETFVAVARAHSFSGAGRALHKTQPAISYQIRRLEEQLGATLLDRTTRRLTLTPGGARLFDLCERFFGEFAHLAASLSDGSAVEPEPLRIEAVSGFGRYVLFPRLCRMPDLPRYSLRFPEAGEVLRSLEDGRCELGFVYLPHVSNRLATTPVWLEELVLIAPFKGRKARQVTSLSALEAVPFVTYDESDYVFGKWFEGTFGRQPRALRSFHHFEELEEVVDTVAMGRGWSIVPDFCAEAAVAAGKVEVVRHPKRRVRNRIYAVTRAGAPEHPRTAEVLKALQVVPG